MDTGCLRRSGYEIDAWPPGVDAEHGRKLTCELGYTYRPYVDRIFDGYRLERAGTGHAKTNQWRVVKVE